MTEEIYRQYIECTYTIIKKIEMLKLLIEILSKDF